MQMDAKPGTCAGSRESPNSRGRRTKMGGILALACVPPHYTTSHVFGQLPRSSSWRANVTRDRLNAWLIELGRTGIWATTPAYGGSNVKDEYLRPLHDKTSIFLSGDADKVGR